MNNNFQLKQIAQNIIECKLCPLHKTRTLPVIGQGNHYANIMMIGEAPGAEEDKTGCPFCGRAGKILDGLLQSISLNRKDIYITNVIKCRPPNNRDPKIMEETYCSSYLEKQIDIIKPKIICTLGRISFNWVRLNYGLITPDNIGQYHGQVFEKDNFKFIPLYHPASALYNKSKLITMLEDIKILKQ